MHKLNNKAYKTLQKESAEQSSEDYGAWYKLSHQLFTKRPLNDINDFWKIIAFAYSWMPTIPSINTELLKEEKGEDLLKVLQALKQHEIINREKLLQTLVPVINNSLVGTSKVLHFIAPDILPIIDSRVQRGWGKFFFENHPKEYEIKKLPSPNVSMNAKHIQHYLYYWETLENWKATCNNNTTIRNIEICFYKLGGKPKTTI